MIPPTSQKNYQVDSKIKSMIHHDQREGYQQPNSFRNRSGSVPQGVKEVSHLGPKFHVLVRSSSNTISWA